MSLINKLQILTKSWKDKQQREAKTTLEQLAKQFPKDCMSFANEDGWTSRTVEYDKSLLWDAKVEQEEFVKMVADACKLTVEELKVTQGNCNNFYIKLDWGEKK